MTEILNIPPRCAGCPRLQHVTGGNGAEGFGDGDAAEALFDAENCRQLGAGAMRALAEELSRTDLRARANTIAARRLVDGCPGTVAFTASFGDRALRAVFCNSPALPSGTNDEQVRVTRLRRA